MMGVRQRLGRLQADLGDPAKIGRSPRRIERGRLVVTSRRKARAGRRAGPRSPDRQSARSPRLGSF